MNELFALMENDVVTVAVLRAFANLLVAVVGILITYALRKLDRTLDRMSERLDSHDDQLTNHSTRIARLEGFQEGRMAEQPK